MWVFEAHATVLVVHCDSILVRFCLVLYRAACQLIIDSIACACGVVGTGDVCLSKLLFFPILQQGPLVVLSFTR